MANRFMLNETSYHGKGAINNIVPEIQNRGFKNILVCTDASLVKSIVIFISIHPVNKNIVNIHATSFFIFFIIILLSLAILPFSYTNNHKNIFIFHNLTNQKK